MSYIQGTVVERDFYLTLSGTPATGITPGDVTCKIRKSGSTSFTVKTLDSTSWFELGAGFYMIRFNTTDSNTAGDFFYTLSATQFDNFHSDEFTIVPPGVTPPPPAGFCAVSGNVLTAGNTIPSNCRVTFRPLQFPLSVGNSVVTADAIVTYPDINGNFTVNLVQGVTMVVEIQRTGIRAQILIPMTSNATLVSLLPAFPYPPSN